MRTWTSLTLAALIGLVGFSLVGVGLGEEPKTVTPAKKDRVVIPFDFESKFDGGRYGQKIGDLVWSKLEREGTFVIPESMQDVRDWCQRSGMVPNPDTPLNKLAEIVRKEQAGDIAIWGKVERVAGASTDVYDLWIYVADFSAPPGTMLYQKKVRTKSVSEIPHTYIKQALETLHASASPSGPRPTEALIRQRWEKGPNLVEGTFAEGRSSPRGWDPLPRHVTWVGDPGSKARNRIVRFTLPRDVAATTGVLYYSNFFPIEEGATYRFQCRWRTTGSAVKVFIKCYDKLPTGYRPRSGTASNLEEREVYRSQQNLKGPSNTWNTHTEDFTPRHTRYTPQLGRVMLYAYWPAGTVEWDDIVVKQITPAPSQAREKEPCPSLESKVRVKDIP
jgi:hypothetical protein